MRSHKGVQVLCRLHLPPPPSASVTTKMDAKGNITEHETPKAVEPVKKMHKFILGGVEMQVEQGSTMTIGGVSVVLG